MVSGRHISLTSIAVEIMRGPLCSSPVDLDLDLDWIICQQGSGAASTGMGFHAGPGMEAGGCVYTLCSAFCHTLQENNADVMPKSTPLVVDKKNSAVDITATEAVPPGLGKAAHSKSDGSLLLKKQGTSDTTENESMLEGETSWYSWAMRPWLLFVE